MLGMCNQNIRIYPQLTEKKVFIAITDLLRLLAVRKFKHSIQVARESKKHGSHYLSLVEQKIRSGDYFLLN